MALISILLSTELGVAVAAPALILLGCALRAASGRAAATIERRISSRRRWS